MQGFQHVILGTGQAMGTLLGYLIPTGESVAVIEGGQVGGSCVNTGCTPTKALVASAKVAHTVRRAPEYGIFPADLRVVFPAVLARMNRIRDNSGLVDWLENAPNVTLIRGWGRFTGPRQITVGGSTIKGERVYVNAGTRPHAPPIPGLESVPWLDNRRILEVAELPGHLIVLGGGYIGLEFAQIFSRLGSRVSVIERTSQLLPREDRDVAQAIRDILELEGIEVLTDTTVTGVAPSRGGIEVSFNGQHDRRSIAGSHLLVATGTVPNSDRLGLEAGGVDLDDRGFIAVDDFCRTSAEGVFALGDINGHGAFTHTSVNDAEVVLDLMRGGSRKLSDRVKAYAVFVDPPLGRVGLTEEAALAHHRNVLRAIRPMSRISRAKEMGQTLGFAKLLVDGEDDRILGAAILGAGGDEIINMMAAHMASGLTAGEFRRSVLVHPTISELVPWILDDLEPVRTEPKSRPRR